MKLNNKINEIRINKESLGGYQMKIIEYNKYDDIVIEFQDKYKAKVHTTYQHFKNGNVKNPFHPSVFNVAYYGQGKYKSRGKDGKKTKAYNHWMNMLNRCYNPYHLNEFPTYIDCYVCEEWLCFQNFAEWFYENYYECNDEKMCLDKDILCKGNKIYSPETCIFVPNNINILFTKREKERGKYPIGVTDEVKNINNKTYLYLKVNCSTFYDGKCKTEYLGNFSINKPFQAFTCYKQFKENYIKQVADEYKNLIPQKLYEALYKYEVEIND